MAILLSSRRDLLRAGGYAVAAVIVGSAASAEGTVVRDDLFAVFEREGFPGTLVVYDVAADRLTGIGAARAARRYVPASTFKIPNSLIALETGVVKDAGEVFRYDGKPRPVKAWEKDMTLREAMAASNVPVYQEIARRIGLARYRDWMARLDYGNRQLGTIVDQFWLDGPLEISAVEQARFLASFGAGRLPVSERSRGVVRDIVRIEEKAGRALFAKTGWSGKIGWWAGWVEQGSRITSFALNMDMTRLEDAPKRIAIGKELLARLGVY
ncbi:MAG: class D beta-lactamase [Hyphomicrobiaceae bacterium]